MNRIKHIANHLTITDDELKQKKCSRGSGRGQKVVVIGSGLIGQNFAVLFGRASYNVCMYDIKQDILNNAMKTLGNDKLPLMEKYDMLFGESASNVFSKFSTTTNLRQALKNAIFLVS